MNLESTIFSYPERLLISLLIDWFMQFYSFTHTWLALKWQRIGDVSKEIKRVRAQMEENEDLAILMKGLRGQNLKDSQFAEDDVDLRLVEVSTISFPCAFL